jgi:hypothetical protein
VSFRKYLVLAAVAVFAAAGDVCLARGMRDFGAVSLVNIGDLIARPWLVSQGTIEAALLGVWHQ